ncbi:MAG: LPXTG cell wall anchor domain-containing protein [Bacilli bacterium]|nr:LPXTG cell wall anchor domain-containing protein [Bacilli bacterium]
MDLGTTLVIIGIALVLLGVSLFLRKKINKEEIKNSKKSAKKLSPEEIAKEEVESMIIVEKKPKDFDEKKEVGDD